MDALDKLIAEKRQAISAVEAEIASHEAKVASLRESILLATVELAAFERAAALRPFYLTGGDEDSSDAHDSDGKRRGRQKGAISLSWRTALGYLYMMDEPFDHEKMLEVAQGCGITTSLASIRDRARDYVDRGLLDRSGDASFVVTEKAAKQFKFDQAPVAGHGGTAPEMPEIEEEDNDGSDAETLREQGASGDASFLGDSDGGGMAS
ncbi:hypothetical protein [Methylobacterium indicum]|uniref:Uncharacterized protein n=1 Tax=Methylobacterium indicum TaxID=1775910 RepID=A0A8H9C677_9HYPH|nr:hypothetical protein [Methylobacterium indicum]BCM83586.1 hypothetical protein mvi_20470 [Methylobacterium indicum]